MWLLLDESTAGMALDYVMLHAADKREARVAIDRALFGRAHKTVQAARQAKIDRAIRSERLREKGRAV